MAHLKSPHSLMHFSAMPRQSCGLSLQSGSAAAKGAVNGGPERLVFLTARVYSLARSDRGGHEPEDGMD